LIPALVAIPWAIVQFFKMQKLRREDPLYARIVSRQRAFWLGTLLVIGGALPFVILAFIIVSVLA
jgi:hypothetical protein